MRIVSHDFGYKAAQTLYYATGEQSVRVGLPLNTWMTINFSMTPIEPWEAVGQFQRWRDNHFRKWARRPQKGRGKPFDPAFAYVFENATKTEVFETIGPDCPHNVNAHCYLHIPPERLYDFRARAVEWMDFIAGEICQEGTVDIVFVKKDNGIGRYCLKGARPYVAEHFGQENHSPQGAIIGKRAGTSQNLGRSARMNLDRLLGIDRKANMHFGRVA